LSVALALQIEAYLALKEGALAELQLWYDIRKAKGAQGNIPPKLKILRRSLFWDADYDTLDMDVKSSAIIRRVNERGTPEERKAVREYYGEEQVNTVLAAEPGTSYARIRT
jgi:hypothetical protein